MTKIEFAEALREVAAFLLGMAAKYDPPVTSDPDPHVVTDDERPVLTSDGQPLELD